MKLTLKLEWEEGDSLWSQGEELYVEGHFTDKDMQTESQDSCIDTLKIFWASVRMHYMCRTKGPNWYIKEKFPDLRV